MPTRGSTRAPRSTVQHVAVAEVGASSTRATPKRAAASRKRKQDAKHLDITAGAQVHETNDTCCSICLDDEIEPTNKAVVDGCNHAFCLSCLRDWIRYKPEDPLCPLCKRAIRGYTHGYGKLGRGASKRPRLQGAGTADQPFELLDDDDVPGPSSQPAESGEFCLEHTVVQPQPRQARSSSIGLSIMGPASFISVFDPEQQAALLELFTATQLHLLPPVPPMSGPHLGPTPRRSRSSRPARQPAATRRSERAGSSSRRTQRRRQSSNLI